MTSIAEDIANATTAPADKQQRRLLVATVLARAAGEGTLRMSELLCLAEPGRTFSIEVLTDVEDGKGREFGLRDSLSFRALIGKASDMPAQPKRRFKHPAGKFRLKLGVRTEIPAPGIKNFVPVWAYYSPGEIVTMAPQRLAATLPRHGCGLEVAHGIDDGAVRVLELGYEYQGQFHRTVSDEIEADFRASQGLPPASPPEASVPPARRRRDGDQPSLTG